MQILLIRHARAQPRREGRADSERALTAAGRAKLLECRAGLAALRLAPTRILHSPWLRAAQSAALLADDATPIAVHAALARAPDAPLARELAALAERALWCVGHEPWLSELACLLAGLPRANAAAFELKKCGVIALERDGDAWTIGAHLPPRVLRRLR